MRQWAAAIRQLFSIEAVIAAPLMAIGFLLEGSRGLVVGLLVALLIELIAWSFSRPILMRICSARPVTDGEHLPLMAAVSRLAASAGIATPKVAISALPIPNALAAVTPGGGLICVTEGLLGMLSAAGSNSSSVARVGVIRLVMLELSPVLLSAQAPVADPR